MQFTISARGKPAAVPIQKFIKNNFGDIPPEQIDMPASRASLIVSTFSSQVWVVQIVGKKLRLASRLQ